MNSKTNAPHQRPRCPFIHPALPVSLIASGQSRCMRQPGHELPHRGTIGSTVWSFPAVAPGDRRSHPRALRETAPVNG